MKLCSKGLHDLDAPRGRVRSGKQDSGAVRWVCRLCNSKGGRRGQDKLVCDYGDRFSPDNTLWKLNAQGTGMTRVCQKCKRYRDLRSKAKLRDLPVPPPRRKLSLDEIAALEAAIRAEEGWRGQIAMIDTGDEGHTEPQPWDPPGWWALLAACAPGSGVDPEIFYPEDPRNQIALVRARRVCMECPVWSECREYAIRREEPFGIWGGLNHDEREQERRRRERLAS